MKEKILAINKKATQDYEILEKIETGVVLFGPEVKSIKLGNVNLKGSFAKILRGELWLLGMHVGAYRPAVLENYDPKRSRKLLVQKKEIKKLFGKLQERGLVLVPLRVYLKKNIVKIELGLGKAKKLWDKRELLRKKEIKKEIRRQG